MIHKYSNVVNCSIFYDILIWCLALIHAIDLLMNFFEGPINNSAWL